MQSYVQWKYTKEVEVTNPPSSEAQCTFILYHQMGMYRDFSDIRFSTVEKEPISYYLESIDNFNSCRVWLKFPANISKILLHYGNGAAVSESSSNDVFDYFIDFTTFDYSAWTIESGSIKIENSILTVKNASTATIISSKTSYPVNTIVEMRACRESGNNNGLGFKNSATLKAALWSGSAAGVNNDQMMTGDGVDANYVDDGVDRSGTTYYTYGVAHLTAGDKFYVNYSLRGTASSYLPGNVSLPLRIESDVAKAVYIDWVRVRKYLETPPTFTLVKRHIPQTIGYLLNESKYSTTEIIGAYEITQIHHFFNEDESVSIKDESYIGDPLQVFAPDYVYISEEVPQIKQYTELKDYALESCDISKSTSDVYMQLSASFSNEIVPPEGTNLKHVARDSKYVKHTLFAGQVITKTPKLSYLGNSVSIEAADLSRNLSVQPIPWNYQVVSLDDTHTHFGKWIIELLDSTHTGVIQGNIIATAKDDKQFVFEPNTSRYEAITDIAEYMGCATHVKLIEKYDTATDRINIRPALYVVPTKDIDQKYGGFDLPDPIEFESSDITILDEPTVQGEQDTRYNTVLVHGVLSNTSETVVAVACLHEVSDSETWGNVYTYEDNGIYEKGSTAEIEAIKWLLYFNTQKSTVQMKFVDRFDLELYQRIRFGESFSDALKKLTNTKQLSYIIAYDPRDETNSKHSIDVSGVPTPSWLRITEIKHHSENVNSYCEIKAITDYIYSSVDPVIQSPYNQYLAPGYYKPTSDDTVSTIQSVVESTVSQQASLETGTLLSIDADAKTGVIQTASGKIMKVSLPWL